MWSLVVVTGHTEDFCSPRNEYTMHSKQSLDTTLLDASFIKNQKTSVNDKIIEYKSTKDIKGQYMPNSIVYQPIFPVIKEDVVAVSGCASALGKYGKGMNSRSTKNAAYTSSKSLSEITVMALYQL